MQKLIATCFFIALFALNFTPEAQAQGKILKMEVTDFTYEIFSGNDDDGAVAAIKLFGDNKKKGEIRFFPAGKEFLRPDYDSRKGIVTFYYSIDQYMIVKDLLDSGKTIHVKYDVSNKKASVVGSDVDRRTPIDPRKQNGNTGVDKATKMKMQQKQEDARKMKTREGN